MAIGDGMTADEGPSHVIGQGAKWANSLSILILHHRHDIRIRPARNPIWCRLSPASNAVYPSLRASLFKVEVLRLGDVWAGDCGP